MTKTMIAYGNDVNLRPLGADVTVIVDTKTFPGSPRLIIQKPSGQEIVHLKPCDIRLDVGRKWLERQLNQLNYTSLHIRTVGPIRGSLNSIFTAMMGATVDEPDKDGDEYVYRYEFRELHEDRKNQLNELLNMLIAEDGQSTISYQII